MKTSIHTARQARTQAFSLVELSIVLVILGLLVGGVLSGQSLIRAAELRSVNTEYQRYATAIGTFRDKYFALPGDMNNASSFWTTAGNGDGDGVIENHGTAANNEISLFWIHLANASLVEGSYTNVGGTAMTPATHNPRAKLNGAGWNIAGLGTVAVTGVASPGTGVTAPAASTFYANSYGNAFVFGAGTDALLPTGVLRSEEAWNIDTKMDDGKPDSGTVTTLESQGSATAGAGCGNLATSVAAMAASSYDLTNSSVSACSLVFKSGF
ncbi:MAG: type II secretion system protein [Alphaproteobacteria bacterium]|nr:type II secretion system protein [Alphaproteobacteria bacterium]